jgi:hypothetical protein
MSSNRIFDDADLGGAHFGVGGQKALTDRVIAGVGKLDARAGENPLIMSVGDLEKNSRPVTRTGVAARGSAVSQPTEDLDPLRDHIVGGRPTEIGYEA